ncbi:MAG TPA: hypothetical protein VJ464_17420 [Blastocatellia bacterium]|nr:hypothetical protein [Blastocatellia bacterium]
MDQAVSALLGALIGALAGLGATWLTTSRQEQSEHRKWLREKRHQAYTNALKSLSKATVIPIGTNTKEIESWYCGLAEVRESLIALQVYCSNKRIAELSGKLFEAIEIQPFVSVAGSAYSLDQESGNIAGIVVWGVALIRGKIDKVLKEVTRSASSDLGRDIIAN